MIVPVEIFNEIAEYLIETPDELGIILSLSRAINKYVSDDMDDILYRNIFNDQIVVRMTNRWDMNDVSCAKFMWKKDGKIKKIMLCEIKLDECFTYIDGGGFCIGKCVCEILIINNIHEVYWIINDETNKKNEIKFIGLNGKSQFHQSWGIKNRLNSDEIDEFFRELVNMDYGNQFFIDGECNLTLNVDEIAELRGDDIDMRMERVKSIIEE